MFLLKEKTVIILVVVMVKILFALMVKLLLVNVEVVLEMIVISPDLAQLTVLVCYVVKLV